MSSQSSLPQRPSSRLSAAQVDQSAIRNETSTPEEANSNDEDAEGDLPMSMTASVILTNLPKDASEALSLVDELDNFKGTLGSCCVPEFMYLKARRRYVREGIP